MLTSLPCLAVLLLNTASLLLAQSDPEVQTLRDHFTGTWVGTNHDYGIAPTAEAKITIVVTQGKLANRLDMDYAYLDSGKVKEKHFKRSLFIERPTSSIFIDRRGEGKVHFTVDHLEEVLRQGYGDFTLHGTARYKGDARAIVRSEYHLTADRWSYEIYVSPSDGPFEKTGDWSLKKVSAGARP